MFDGRSLKRAEAGERLKTARQTVGLSQLVVAQKVGVSREMVSRWENGRAWPTIDHLRNLIGLYGISMDWLLGNDRRVAEGRQVYEIGPLQEMELASVAIIGAVSAGGLVEAWQDDLGHLEVPRSILREAPRAFGLRVYGNSLASEWIYEGAIVVVDPDAPFVDGRIYAVMIDGGEVAARRIFETGDQLKLVTGEGAVDEYPKARVTIIGRVRWSFREH